MNQGRIVFSQLISFLPDREFRRCVERYQGDLRLRGLTCWDQYLAMAFAQLTYRESLRDIETCLRSLQGKLYHLGFRGKVARSTLADANESRDWRIFADFAQRLIATARRLYVREPMGVDLEQSLYALDSTTIDLCLALFPWARFRRGKAAVKMHTLLDLRGNIPTFIRVTDGKVHDVNMLDEIMPERPRPDSKLAAAPYWNIDSNGAVCAGTMRAPKSLTVTSIAAWQQAFFQSEFTHPGGGGRLTKRHGGTSSLFNTFNNLTRLLGTAKYLIIRGSQDNNGGSNGGCEKVQRSGQA